MVTPVAGGVVPQVQQQDIQPQSPGFGTLMQGSPLQMGPPQTPEEGEMRKQGWSSFLDRVATDPQLQALMFGIGARMAQPIAPGQNTIGHIGQSVSGGMDQYYNVLQQQEQIRQQQERGRRESQIIEQKGELARDAEAGEDRRLDKRLAAEKDINERRLALAKAQGQRQGKEPWLPEYSPEDILNFSTSLHPDGAGNVELARAILANQRLPLEAQQQVVWAPGTEPGMWAVYDLSGRLVPGVEQVPLRRAGSGKAPAETAPPPAAAPVVEEPQGPPTIADFKGMERYVREGPNGEIELWEIIDGEPQKVSAEESALDKSIKSFQEWIKTPRLQPKNQ